MNNIRNNQINRILKKEKKKRLAKVKIIVVGAVVSLGITLAYFTLTQNDKAKADTAQLLNSDEPNNKDIDKRYSDINKDKILENRYNDVFISYKRVLETTTAYESVEKNSSSIFTLKKGDYIKFYGVENTWAKVSKNNQIGYVQMMYLEDIEDGQLTVKDGQLLDSKNDTFPDDFITKFDIDTENAMMVMLEAMKREGMNIDVSSKEYIKPQSKNDIGNSEIEIPNFNNSTLRSGRSIELTITDTSENTNFLDTKEGKWLSENAHKYGFILRYPKDKESVTGFVGNDRIYRYVGVEAATYIYEQNITLEEYYEL